MRVMGQVWGIGERRFGGERRLELFDWQVGSVIGLEAEV